MVMDHVYHDQDQTWRRNQIYSEVKVVVQEGQEDESFVGDEVEHD